MFKQGLMLSLLTAFAVGAVSAAEISLNTLSCSGTSQFEADQAAILDCSSDFILGDGFIYSDQSISISADGALRLDNIRVTAPEINLYGGEIYLGEGSMLEAGQIYITSRPPGFPVTENSDRAIVNWQSYDVSADGSVIYSQPASGSISLTAISGDTLDLSVGSAGTVRLLSPHGILLSSETVQIVPVASAIPLPGALLLFISSLSALYLRKIRKK